MTLTIQPLDAPQHDELREFFKAIPEGDRAFFKDDVANERVVERLGSQGVVRVAVEEGRILGFASLVPGIARASHVADLRLVVAHEARRRGLGRSLARHMLLEAIWHGFLKVTVDVPVTNEPAIAMFRNLGFDPEALLRGHLRDGLGQMVDVIVLAHFVEEQISHMTTAGLPEELG